MIIDWTSGTYYQQPSTFGFGQVLTYSFTAGQSTSASQLIVGPGMMFTLDASQGQAWSLDSKYGEVIQ